MIEIKIDGLDAVLASFVGLEAELGQIVKQQLESARQQWIAAYEKPKRRSKTVSDDAEQPKIVYPKDGDPLQGEMIVSDDASKRLQGYGPFDIKIGLLRSPRAKIGRTTGQPYIDVPLMNKNSVTGKPDIRRVSGQYKDARGRPRGTPEWKFQHPGYKGGNLEATQKKINENIERDLESAIKKLFR